MDVPKITITFLLLGIFLIALYEAIENDKIRKLAAEKFGCSCGH